MRIISWNTQGFSWDSGKLSNLINKFHPDVVCLQECGDIPNVKNHPRYSNIKYKLYNFGTSSRECNYHVYYYPWRNGCRCSMATLIKTCYNVKHVRLFSYRPIYMMALKDLRPMLQIVIDCPELNYNYLSINNVHLPSGNYKFAMSVARYFFSYCKANYFYSKAIMIGDMNIPYFEWIFEKKPYRMVVPNSLTQKSGNTLDYAFTDIKEMLSMQSGTSFNSSDHLPVILDLL